MQNLHQVFNNKPAVHCNQHYYTEVEKTCMALSIQTYISAHSYSHRRHETSSIDVPHVTLKLIIQKESKEPKLCITGKLLANAA